MIRVGTEYSAGPNIDIQDDVISGKDWTDEIAEASANAYNAATAEIPDPFDPSYISGQIDNKLDTTAFTAWQNGQYATDLQTIEGQISNKLDASSFSDVSGSFYTNDNPSGFITGVDLSPYYTTADANTLSSMLSGAIDYVSANAGDDFPQSADEAIQTYQQYSGTYLTENDIVNKLDISAFTAWSAQEFENDYELSAGEGVKFYEDDELKITRIDVTGGGGGGGDPEVNAYVSNNSATINGTTDLVQNSSGLWNDVAVYQSNSANYLTAHQDLSNYYTTAEANSLSSMLSGAIDYVSANAGGESNVITDDGEFTVLPNTLGTNVTVKYPMDVASYGEPSATPFHEGEWVDWEGNSGADPNNIGSRLGMILHYSDTTTINLEGIQLQVTLPNTISGVNGMCLYYLNPGFGSPTYGPAASNSITSNDNTYSGKYVFNCVGNPFSASTGTYGCYLGLGFSRAASVYGPSSIDARFDTLEYGPATGYEVNLNRYIPSGDNYIAVGVNSATKQTVISATYSLTGNLNNIYPTYRAVTANSATWNSVSSKADKDSLSVLKSEFISDNGTYILHVPSACDIIGTQLSSYDIVGGSVFTSAEFSRRNDYTWQNALICSAFFDMNTQSAYYDFQTDAWGVIIKIVDGNGNNILSAELEEYSPLTGKLTNLTPGSYTARLECTGFGVDFQNKNTMLYFSGEGISTKTYSGLFIGGGGGGVPQSAFDELKQSYDALSSLFATYSGQWLLPNEGEE